jgi:PAS domain S-box-containing protein
MHKPKLNILVIDDDEDDYFFTMQYLSEIRSLDITCTWTYKIGEAQQKLKSNFYDVYFLDYRLGAKTGLELLKEAVAQGCYKPVILLTGKGNPEIDTQAVEAGAYDYLIKGEISSEKLERSLRYALERYKSFKTINDNEKKFRLIFENALSFIFTCNEDLVFGDCNPASEYFLGYSPQELKGMPLLRYIVPEEKAGFIKQTQARKNIRNLPIRFISKHGEIKPGNVSLTYFEDENFDVLWQGIVYDETLRLQSEQTRLQSQKIDATYRLVRTLAHEIRNPLTNIGLSLEGIAASEKADASSYVEIVRRSYKRINDIISELLQSSKTVELKPELVDMKTLLTEVLQIAQDRIQLRNIETHVNFPDIPVVKTVDKEKFKIAILNLVVNAIEAMDKEKKLLSLSLNKTFDQTIIQILDNGHGISEDDMKRLFEPYFTTKKSGMGLGLISTLNILKSHQAIIEVDSKYGKGSVFRVIFSEVG